MVTEKRMSPTKPTLHSPERCGHNSPNPPTFQDWKSYTLRNGAFISGDLNKLVLSCQRLWNLVRPAPKPYTGFGRGPSPGLVWCGDWQLWTIPLGSNGESLRWIQISQMTLRSFSMNLVDMKEDPAVRLGFTWCLSCPPWKKTLTLTHRCENSPQKRAKIEHMEEKHWWDSSHDRSTKACAQCGDGWGCFLLQTASNQPLRCLPFHQMEQWIQDPQVSSLWLTNPTTNCWRYQVNGLCWTPSMPKAAETRMCLWKLHL